MNPIPIILVLFVLKKSNIQPPVINTLELESFLDNARTVLNTIDKINGFTQGGGLSNLPDMKKMMEIVDNLPL